MADEGAAGFDYAALTREAFVEVLRRVLTRVAQEGLPGEHHFYVTFGSAEQDVEIPPRLRQQYPEELTIVLQHQFWNLAVDGDGFAVSLRFGGKPERLRVPWSALRAFADPSVGFALRLPSPGDVLAQEPAPAEAPLAVPDPGAVAADADRTQAPRTTKVVDFGAFRRRSEDAPDS